MELAEQEPDYSDLAEYVDVMATLRGKGFSYREIARWLGERGVEISHNTVYRLFTRDMSYGEAEAEKQEASLEEEIEQQKHR